MVERPLTLAEMADRLGTTEKTFRETVRDRRVPFITVGKRRKFDAAEVVAYLKTTEEPVTSNVVAFPIARKRRTKRSVVSKKFAEAT